MSYQLYNLVVNGLAPIIEMVIKYCWYPWMSEYVGITLQYIHDRKMKKNARKEESGKEFTSAQVGHETEQLWAKRHAYCGYLLVTSSYWYNI